jgi:hypothetical protein
MRVGLAKSQADNHIVAPIPAVVPNSSQTEFAKPVQPVSLYRCILHSKLITTQISDSDKDIVTAPASPDV